MVRDSSGTIDVTECVADSLPVVVLRHEVEQRTTGPANGAVQRLDGLDRRRALRFVQDREVLRGEGGVVGQVRVTEVRALDERGHRRVGVVTRVEATTDGEERLARWEVVGRDALRRRWWLHPW